MEICSAEWIVPLGERKGIFPKVGKKCFTFCAKIWSSGLYPDVRFLGGLSVGGRSPHKKPAPLGYVSKECDLQNSIFHLFSKTINEALPLALMPNILIAENNTIVLEGLAALLETEEDITVVALAKDGEEALLILGEQEKHIDIAILDLFMPKYDGIELTKIIREKYPEIKIIILTVETRIQYLDTLTQEGRSIDGYLKKGVSKKELVEAIHIIDQGGSYFSPEMLMKLMDYRVKKNNKNPIVTKQESKVWELIVAAYSSKEIAEILSVSITTIHTHRKHLNTKLGIKNVAALTILAFEKNMMEEWEMEFEVSQLDGAIKVGLTKQERIVWSEIQIQLEEFNQKRTYRRHKIDYKQIAKKLGLSKIVAEIYGINILNKKRLSL